MQSSPNSSGPGADPRALLDRAIRHHQAGQLPQAEKLYREALSRQPGSFEAHNNLAHVLTLRGQTDEALSSYTRSIGLNPRYALSRNNLGGLLLRLDRPAEAVEHLEVALCLDPRSFMAHNNLGTALRQLGRLDEAITHHQRAIELKPDHASALNNLALALVQKGRLGEGIRAYRKALAAQPDYSEAHFNLAGALTRQGEVEEALSAYRTTLRLSPKLHLAHTGMLLCLHYSAAATPGEILAAHRRFDEQIALPLAPKSRPVYAGTRDPGRPLRVGYVSADLRQHSVSYFVEPLLRGHRRDAFHITCYASVARPDGVTERLRGLCDTWRDVRDLSDEALAALVQRDQIDVLVDLCGHTSDNRLLCFARRPAPVQVTYLGYPGTTGMSAIDFRLTDGWADPPGHTEAFHTETLYRLENGFLCYQPPAEAPEVGPLPMAQSGQDGRVTFASFNNRPKMTGWVVATWAAILRALPGSRLLLKSFAYGDPLSQRRTESLFTEHGIAADRLTLLPQVASQEDHLSIYRQADIALDTFPYNGTTTTCEALWMGVPVIALAGQTHVSRVGVSLLSRVGLDALLAGSSEEYIELAVKLAGDPARLGALRAGLRQRMRESRLLDPAAVVPEIEHAYRYMWRAHCALG